LAGNPKSAAPKTFLPSVLTGAAVLPHYKENRKIRISDMTGI